eukprot:TRINITY_DN17980_c0_g1_i17.p1 TRINITY_DN17980_c0_g1~~TRINITY_DN17980_c0_g1_i17.p1  ORF type:complete len:169 (-),score=33.38 TRINITY_DN17980_c0_g1_i17:64-570(-)
MFDFRHVTSAFHKLGGFKDMFDPAERESRVLRELAQRTQRMMESNMLDARACAQVFWAVAALQDKVPRLAKLFVMLVKTIKLQVDEMNGQDLSNIIYACANADIKEELLHELLPVLTKRAIVKARGFDPQALSNIIWAGATLKDKAPELLEIFEVLVEFPISFGQGPL